MPPLYAFGIEFEAFAAVLDDMKYGESKMVGYRQGTGVVNRGCDLGVKSHGARIWRKPDCF
jgi:hypothetical protein